MSETSGQVQFESGARRSSVKPFYCEIPYLSLRRVALRAVGAPDGQVRHDAETGFDYEGGAGRYGYHNWAAGLPFEDTFNHLIEHLYWWKSLVERGGLPEEDHLAAAAWAVLFPLMTFERAYVEQAMMRNRALDEGATPAQADEAVRAAFKHYLLQPIARP